MRAKIFIRNIPDDIWRNLKARAVLDGKTISKAVLEAIKLWLAKDRNEVKEKINWKGICSLFHSNYTDTSINHDKYIMESKLKISKK